MINAGAIATTGLVAGRSAQTRRRRILEALSLYAGRKLQVDEAVYRSESETGHRNRAIGYMLRNFGILEQDPLPAVELYFEQCSISVTCRDLGIMAATLANRGVNPVTGKQALRGEYVESVLSVMGTCGMYDYAGEWLYQVGIPAKSGVAGGLIAVLPGQLGIGVFSPPLDERGNSVRGIRVCNAISRHFDLHLYNRASPGKSAIRARFSAAEFGSNRVRTDEQTAALRRAAHGVRAYQLQGHLSFTTAEPIVQEVIEEAPVIDALILDFKRVLSVSEGACRLLHQLLEKFAARDKPLVLSATESHPLVRRYLRAKLGHRAAGMLHHFADTDRSLEWCEDRLLASLPDQREPDTALTPVRYELFRGLTPGEIKVISGMLVRQRYRAGDEIIRVGDEAHEMFLLARGTAGVVVTNPQGGRRRVATFSPGMNFGEMAFLDRAPRSSLVVAETEAECDVLTLDAMEDLSRTHPQIKITLLKNLCLDLCRKLRKADRQLSAYD